VEVFDPAIAARIAVVGWQNGAINPPGARQAMIMIGLSILSLCHWQALINTIALEQGTWQWREFSLQAADRTKRAESLTMHLSISSFSSNDNQINNEAYNQL